MTYPMTMPKHNPMSAVMLDSYELDGVDDRAV